MKQASKEKDIGVQQTSAYFHYFRQNDMKLNKMLYVNTDTDTDTKKLTNIHPFTMRSLHSHKRIHMHVLN